MIYNKISAIIQNIKESVPVVIAIHRARSAFAIMLGQES